MTGTLAMAAGDLAISRQALPFSAHADSLQAAPELQRGALCEPMPAGGPEGGALRLMGGYKKRLSPRSGRRAGRAKAMI